MVGPYAWIKNNILSSTTDIIITIIAGWLLFEIIPPLMDWLFIDAAYTGESRDECRAKASGACWAFISERFNLFIYGFYPAAERWRVNLSFILLIAIIIPVLFDKTPYRKYVIYPACAFPFIAAWLLVGGFGLTPVATDQFGGFMLTLVIGVTGYYLLTSDWNYAGAGSSISSSDHSSIFNLLYRVHSRGSVNHAPVRSLNNVELLSPSGNDF